jgi:2,3-bisphosphoglycerate-independent phosphoglycerate mutase
MPAKRIMLVIMDGWGLGKVASADAIKQAQTPFVDSLYARYPNTTLTTCGEAVGLPDGQMGNSEVGHLNLGAGRIVYQELQRINVSIREGKFAQNPALQASINHARNNHSALHLIGLVSNGGVHSHINHLKAILDRCRQEDFHNVFIHAFTDGRDCDPKSGIGFIRELELHCSLSTGRIASVSGRYYAMDRDKRWERVKQAYDVLVHGKGGSGNSATEIVANSYQDNITDEFIRPSVVVNEQGNPLALIRPNDAVICFNFRTDRCREITQALTQFAPGDPVADSFGLHRLPLHYTTMTEYDKTYRDVNVIFETDDLNHTLGQVLEEQGLSQIRIAETEKYPHVTFFFSGGREQPFNGEKRLLVPSPKVATYDLQPEMSARELNAVLLPEIRSKSADFICLNYANADMVGHTGVWAAAIRAVETVDGCVKQIVETGLENGYTIFLTADHGNADFMINEDGSPNTAHTLNPVPFFIIDPEWRGTIRPGKLGDIAPTILKMMGLPQPVEMTGEILI